MTEPERVRSWSWKPVLGGIVTGFITWLFVDGILDMPSVWDLLFDDPDNASEAAISIVGARVGLLTMGIATIACTAASVLAGRSGRCSWRAASWSSSRSRSPTRASTT